jgi:N-ethylmaleimide reductase
MSEQDILLNPYQLNEALHLKNRIVMAPMTRAMANDDNTPTEAMAHYYARRADAGLLITEGVIISQRAQGFYKAPGLFSPAQVAGWRQVTDAVHVKQGLIFAQLWHVGRVSHPEFLQGELPLSASETTMTGKIRRGNGLMYGKSRAASVQEINELVKMYVQAAVNAIAAGFDGVEIHGANGYLIDQFLHHHTNIRSDHYGGTPENMTRFALDIVKAVGDAIGYQRVGLRISPGGYMNEITTDTRDALVFAYLMQQLNTLDIAYLHTGNFDDKVIYPELENLNMTRFIRKHYTGKVIACGAYSVDEARAGFAAKDFDLIAYGRPFIANPDLITKISHALPVKEYDVSMLEQLV